jgi:hypothetical protein
VTSDDEAAGAHGRRHPRRGEPAAFWLHVRLEETFPPVWRRLEVASDVGLDDLHDVLQVAYGWEDRHLYRFTTGPQMQPGDAFVSSDDLRGSEPDDEGTPAWQVRLDELLAVPGDRLHYQYDYGDNWWLTIELEDVDPDHAPRSRADCLDGAGAGPPEDCGGPYAYELIVGALDPAHPDHRERRNEFARIYGEEVPPTTFDLLPFDTDRISRGLADLHLPSRPATPRPVNRALQDLHTRARSWRARLQLRAFAAAADQPISVDQDTATRMTRAYRWLLERVGDDGVRLTAAGYLPPTLVRAAFDELEMADQWIGAGNREDLTLPVLELRTSAQQLGLIRKHRGRLHVTRRGRALIEDPVDLWYHLAARMPIGGRDHEDAARQAGIILLGALATGTTTAADRTIAETLGGLGWMQQDGRPLDRYAAITLTRHDHAILQRLGALAPGTGWPGTATPDGVTFARAALSP